MQYYYFMYVYTCISGIICIIQLYHNNVNIHYIYTQYLNININVYTYTKYIYIRTYVFIYVHIKSTQQMKQPTHKRLFDQRTNMFGFKQPIWSRLGGITYPPVFRNRLRTWNAHPAFRKWLIIIIQSSTTSYYGMHTRFYGLCSRMGQT